LRGQIEGAMGDLRKDLERGEPETVKRRIAEFSALVQKLGEAVYAKGGAGAGCGTGATCGARPASASGTRPAGTSAGPKPASDGQDDNVVDAEFRRAA
jgi:hypothetical protein